MGTKYISFEDFQSAPSVSKFIAEAINWHLNTITFKTAKEAELYDRQLNPFIMTFTKQILTAYGTPTEDPTSTFKPIPSNLFHELNSERCMYSLGNGVTFPSDDTKAKLGKDFDSVLRKAGMVALEQGQAFIYIDIDRCYVFPLTQFVPLRSERDSSLRAGIRFWRIADNKPMYAVLYEQDGLTEFGSTDGKVFEVIEAKRPYKIKVSTTVMGTTIDGGENYKSLPIIDMLGDENMQSTLVGMKEAIDNFDLIQSGFADNVANCQSVYWLINNCGGMNDEDLAEFRQNLFLRKIATVPSSEGASVTPYTVNIPTDAHTAALTSLHERIYHDYGAVDTNAISADSKTATAIEASYLPMDLRADAFEYQIIDCVTRLLALVGVEGDDAVPSFKRNRVVNEAEITSMVLSAAEYLDAETILSKLPFISPDEMAKILEAKRKEETDLIDDLGE